MISKKALKRYIDRAVAKELKRRLDIHVNHIELADLKRMAFKLSSRLKNVVPDLSTQSLLKLLISKDIPGAIKQTKKIMSDIEKGVMNSNMSSASKSKKIPDGVFDAYKYAKRFLHQLRLINLGGDLYLHRGGVFGRYGSGAPLESVPLNPYDPLSPYYHSRH